MFPSEEEKKGAVLSTSEQQATHIIQGNASARSAQSNIEEVQYTKADYYHADADAPSQEECRRVLRKIDLRLMPIMCCIYGIQFLDKTSLGYAAVMGLRTDTHLNGSQYSWVSSVFYLGYLAWEYPAIALLQRFSLTRALSCNVLIWGGILMSMAACKNFGQLMAVRFLLGAFESSITPGFAMLTSRFYQKYEQGARTGIWFSFNGLGGVLGAFLAYGLNEANASGDLAIAGWKVVFLLLGAVTVAFGVLMNFILADSPESAGFLKEDERKVACYRLRDNQQGKATKTFQRHHVKEALTDPAVWLYVLFTALVTIPNGAITNYSSILIKGLGFETKVALLLQAPANAIAAFSIFASLYLGDKFRRRILFVQLAYGACLIGALVVWVLPQSNRIGRLLGVYLMFTFPAGFAAVISLAATNVAGSTKKSVALGMILVAYCTGNLIGPQVFQDKDAPRYNPALITIFACFVGGLITIGLVWMLNFRENRRRDEICQSSETELRYSSDDSDETDRENLRFRYVI